MTWWRNNTYHQFSQQPLYSIVIKRAYLLLLLHVSRSRLCIQLGNMKRTVQTIRGFIQSRKEIRKQWKSAQHMSPRTEADSINPKIFNLKSQRFKKSVYSWYPVCLSHLTIWGLSLTFTTDRVQRLYYVAYLWQVTWTTHGHKPWIICGNLYFYFVGRGTEYTFNNNFL